MARYASEEIINIGWGQDISVRELAELIRRIVGFAGSLEFDPSKPDGAPRKLLDVSKLAALQWAPKIGLEEGIASSYRWFLDNQGLYRA
jgi:GDP-L-fucose synthase